MPSTPRETQQQPVYPAKQAVTVGAQATVATHSSKSSALGDIVGGSLMNILSIVAALLSILFFLKGEWIMALSLAIVAVGSLLLKRAEKHPEQWNDLTKWTMTTASPFAMKHWQGIWVTVSAIGIVWVLIFGGFITTLIGWAVSLMAAVMTMFSVWSWLGKQINKTLDGKYGWFAAVAFVECMLAVTGLCLLFNDRNDYATLCLGTAMSIPFVIALAAGLRKIGNDIFKF